MSAPRAMVFAVAVTIIANVIARASALLSQVIVGLYLTESQVGAFALALGINGFCCLLRSGGASYYLPTLRSHRFDHDGGRYFLWGSVFAGAGGLLSVMSAAALPGIPWLRSAAEAPGLASSLILLGVRHWTMPITLLARSRMAVNLRFGELAKLDTANALLRLAVTWACAYAGLGALALVIPLLVSSVAEALYCSCAAGLTRDSFRWKGARLREMSHGMGWPLAVASLTSLGLQCHFLIIGAMVPVNALGIFYFALQLTLQPVMVVGLAFQSVFAPLLAQHRGHREAECDLITRVFMGSMLLVPVTTISIGGLFPLVERLIWHGKWADANVPIAWLSLGATFSTATAVLVGPLLGARHFRALAGIELSRALGIFGGAAVGGVVATLVPEQDHPMLQPASLVGASTALGMTVTSIGQLVRVMTHFGLAPSDIATHIIHGPAISMLAMVGALSLAESAAASFPMPPGAAGAAIELAIASAAFGAVVLLAFRTLAESTVRAVAEILPGPYRPLYDRIMLLPPSSIA